MTNTEKIMGRALQAAGWKKLGVSDTWQSPNTGLCLKRKKAWQLMQARKAVMGFATYAVTADREKKEANNGL